MFLGESASMIAEQKTSRRNENPDEAKPDEELPEEVIVNNKDFYTKMVVSIIYLK